MPQSARRTFDHGRNSFCVDFLRTLHAMEKQLRYAISCAQFDQGKQDLVNSQTSDSPVSNAAENRLADCHQEHQDL